MVQLKILSPIQWASPIDSSIDSPVLLFCDNSRSHVHFLKHSSTATDGAPLRGNLELLMEKSIHWILSSIFQPILPLFFPHTSYIDFTNLRPSHRLIKYSFHLTLLALRSSDTWWDVPCAQSVVLDCIQWKEIGLVKQCHCTSCQEEWRLTTRTWSVYEWVLMCIWAWQDLVCCPTCHMYWNK